MRSRLSRREVIGALSAASALQLFGARVGGGVAPASGELPQELWRASAAQLRAAIVSGKVSSVEVVEAHLARVEAVNAKVNAVVRVLAEDARQAAAAADAALARGAEPGPLFGVPFTIKENIDLVGTPTTEGVPAMAQNLAHVDAPVVERMKAAGAIPLGRTNLPDFGLRVHTRSGLHGTTLNPWSAKHNVGGSSGGEGAALATGMSPIGLGNDIGGSLRNPAHCCGIAALKPSFGRIPDAGGGGSSLAGQLMAVQGPMARRVADLRIGYRILSGVHVRDPWSLPVPLEGPAPARPIRVALVPEPSGGTTHPSVSAGVRKAGKALADAGYAVEELEPPRLVDAARIWGVFIASELQLALPAFRQIMSADALAFLEPGIAYLRPADLSGYAQNLGERHEVAAAWSEFQGRYPLIVGPVFTQPPFLVGYDSSSPDAAADVLDQLRVVVCANILGLPSVAVPVGIADGLPQGVQVIGDRYREDLCLDAAQAIEDALGIFTPIDPV